MATQDLATQDMIKLLVGLGNPGKNFEQTRHNIGFMVLDALKDDKSPHESWRKQHGGMCASIEVGEQNIRLLKPLTMMNLSGNAVGEMARYYRLHSSEILVIHDDIDLPFAALRMKEGGGHGGHNGLRSIDQHIGNGYRRLRFGVARPKSSTLLPKQGAVSHHVLSSFSQQEKIELAHLVPEVTERIADLTAELNRAQQSISIIGQEREKWASPVVS